MESILRLIFGGFCTGLPVNDQISMEFPNIMIDQLHFSSRLHLQSVALPPPVADTSSAARYMCDTFQEHDVLRDSTVSKVGRGCRTRWT